MNRNSILNYYLKINDCDLELNFYDDDDFVFKHILEKNFSYGKIYNFYIVIKYCYNDIDFYTNMNIYENKFFKFNKFDDLKIAVYVVAGITHILENIINEFTYNNLTKIHDSIPPICVSVQNVSFNTYISDEFIKTFKRNRVIKKDKTSYSDDIDEYIINYEIKENIEYNLKITLLHRFKIIEIVNNAKTLQKNEKVSILFTNGNTLILRPNLIKKLKTLLYLKKNISTTPTILTFKENKTVNNLLNNSNFNYNIWLEKANNRINFFDPKLQSLLNQKYDLTEVVTIINYLNNIQIFVNKQQYLNLKNIILNNSDFINTFNTNKKIKYDDSNLNTNLNVTAEVITNSKNITNKNLSSMLELELIFKKLDTFFLSNNKCYYNSYKLDRRTRIYVANWPLNYQTSHFIRSIISVNKEVDVNEIYKIFFTKDYFKKIKELKIFWMFKRFNLNKIALLLKKIKINLDLNYLKSKDCDDLSCLNDFLFLEVLIIILINKAPALITNFQKKLDYSVEFLLKIDNLEDWGVFDTNTTINKSFFENWKIKTLLDGILLNDCCFTYWADASSNAFQLIALTTGTQNSLLLKLLNITFNDTEYKNIYDYAAVKLQNLDYGFCDVKAKNKIKNWVTLQLIKTIIMPMSYGKTKWSCVKSVTKDLNELKCEVWNDLKANEKEKLINFWYDNCLEILTNLDLDIIKHIELCKKYVEDANIKTKWLNIPICTSIYKILNRSKQREKIKNIKNKLKNALNLIKKIEVYKNVTDEDLITIARSLKKSENVKKSETPELYEIRKLYKSLKSAELKLKVDENNTRRLSICLKINRRYQLRLIKCYNKLINLLKQTVAITPNTTHSLDASLLFKLLQELRILKIDALVIHDSIGCNIKLLPIVIFLYKKTLLDLVKDFQNGELYYPYNKFNHEYKIIDDLELKIYNSNSLFF